MELGNLYCISDCGLAIVEAFVGTHKRLDFLQEVFDAKIINNGYISFKLDLESEMRCVSQFPYFFVQTKHLSLEALERLRKINHQKLVATNMLYATIDALPHLTIPKIKLDTDA